MIKNAFAYVTRKSLKSLIIILVILSMSTLSLISLSIKDATDRASKETFANITNSFSMEINRQVNPGTPRGGGNVPCTCFVGNIDGQEQSIQEQQSRFVPFPDTRR